MVDSQVTGRLRKDPKSDISCENFPVVLYQTCHTSRGSLVRIQYRPQLVIKILWQFCFKVFFVMYTVLDTLNPCPQWSNGKAKLSQHRCLVVTYPLIDYLPTFPKILPQTNEARKLPPFVPVSSPEMR